MPKEIRRYFCDVSDPHASWNRLPTTTTCSPILLARLSQVTVTQNNNMRNIAAWAAIAAMRRAG